MKLDREHYVYKILNVQTQQYYIGVRSTKEIKNDNYMGSSSIWGKTYVKENRDVLTKCVLATYASRKLANVGEVEFLSLAEGDCLCINILYKIIPSSFGKKQSPEHIAKRIHSGERAPMYGKHHTEEAKRKISENSASRGKPMSDEMKVIMKKIHTGKTVSEESRQKSSQTKKERFRSGEIKMVSRSVRVVDLLLDTVSDFPSLKEFTNKEKLNYGSVKVYARRGLIYKERYKVVYTSELKIQP